MRLGTYLPFAGPGGVPFDAHEVAVRARRVEAAGFDGVWVGDGSYRRIAPWPDPLSWLLAVAAGTESLEVGTAIFQVPLRSPVDLAQRFMTLRALTKDRLTIGVGPGSTATDYAAYGIPSKTASRDYIVIWISSAGSATLRRSKMRTYCHGRP